MICREDAQCATEKEKEWKAFTNYCQYIHMVTTNWVKSIIFSQGTHLYQHKVNKVLFEIVQH